MQGPVLAFDLGGTRLKAGVVDGPRAARAVVGVGAWPVGETADSALEVLHEVGRKLAERRDLDCVALCVPGLVEEGVVVSLPGKLPGLEGRDLAALMRKMFNVGAVVVNDALAYAWGVAGAGRTVAVTIGTGVGVGIVDDRVPLLAGRYDGGILGGQIPIADGAPDETDTSDRPGTIEALCRAQRIIDCANRAGGSFETVESVYGGGGDVAEYRGRLARALVALAHAHAPDAIVVGGGAMPADSPVFAGLESLVNKSLFGTYGVRVAPATAGEWAALIGLDRLASRR